ncbi:MAG: hypothetical protein GF364_00410 [Candidatus Lokiarchaeota archaeon]|nr:hypothetical protein [Candidatus Lokiarchaeota archaeon]
MESSYDKMTKEIEELLNETISEKTAIKGITIATHGGKNIYSTLEESFKLGENELAASTTSLLFLATNLFEKLLNQKVTYTMTKGQEWILLCLITKNITGSVILDRKLTELSGVEEYKDNMKNLFLKVSAIIETSEVIKEDLFVQVKRAIPNALSIAIINKEGMPIKIESTMEGPRLAAFIYALYQLTNVILRKKSEYTIINGEFCSFILQKIDEERILGIAVPDSADENIGKYMAKLEEIIRKKN